MKFLTSQSSGEIHRINNLGFSRLNDLLWEGETPPSMMINLPVEQGCVQFNFHFEKKLILLDKYSKAHLLIAVFAFEKLWDKGCREFHEFPDIVILLV